MCGLIGGIGTNLIPFVRSNLGLLNRRGPDSLGIKVFENGLVLGATRLAMTDTHPRSDQPMVDAVSGNFIVFNGEIYNFKQIRINLQKLGIRFSTLSDTEVLLKGLTYYGKSFVKELEGMFAFAFVNTKENSILISRDYLGKKPLYYHLNGGQFLFASQINLIKKYLGYCSLNLNSVSTFLKLGYLLDPQTMFSEINSLVPGEIIEIDLSSLMIKSKVYFIPNVIIAEKAEEDIKLLINNALLERVDGHNKFAISFSGGIDSTYLALLARDNGLNFTTFTMAWDDSDKLKYNEDSVRASKISGKLKFKHRTIQMPPVRLIPEILNEFVLAMSEPNSNPTGLSMMVLYKEISNSGFKLALTGDGADEIFGGYPRYGIAKKLDFLPQIKNKIYRDFLMGSNISQLDKYKTFIMESLDPRFWIHYHRISDDKMLKSIFVDFSTQMPEIYGQDLIELYSTGNNKVASLMLQDLRTWLPMESNRRLDSVSMWNSVEARSPFQSEKVITTAINLMKGRNFSVIDKRLLISTYSLMSEIDFGKRKVGFVSPVGYWLRNNPDLIKESIANLNRIINIDLKNCDHLINSPTNFDYKNLRTLWNLIVLERWISINLSF